MDAEDSQIPWDAFWYRNRVEHFEKRDEVTKKVGESSLPGSRVFHFDPDTTDFWQIQLNKRLEETNSVMYSDFGDNHQLCIRVWGNGVRLFLPYLWLVDTEEDEMIAAILRGIEVSLDWQKRLGY